MYLPLIIKQLLILGLLAKFHLESDQVATQLLILSITKFNAHTSQILHTGIYSAIMLWRKHTSM